VAFSLDKAAIGYSFSLAAASYDRWAEPQRKIAERLDRLLARQPCAGSVLELGCGTGIMTALLQRRYPSSRILAVDIAPGMIEFCRQRGATGGTVRYEVRDAEDLRSDGPFDLVVASCCCQWFTDRARAIRNVRCLTAAGGRVALALLTTGTLAELADSYRAAAGAKMPMMDFWDEGRYRSALAEAGLRPRVARTETVRISYKSPWQVLRSLKGVGATFAHQPWFTPLPVWQVRKLVDCYRRNFAQDGRGRVPASFRVFYVIAGPE
jgi:malonyl-CoA O-methyltransferase